MAVSFRCVKGNKQLRPYIAEGTIAAGDIVIRGSSAPGKVLVGAATSGSLIGVAATGGAATETISVYDHPDAIFQGTTNAAYTNTTHNNKICDIAGTTGAFTVNIGGTTENVVICQGLAATGVDTETTAILFKIVLPQAGGHTVDQTA